MVLCGSPAGSAELFYTDHDAFSGRYTGPVGTVLTANDLGSITPYYQPKSLQHPFGGFAVLVVEPKMTVPPITAVMAPISF